LGRWWSWSEYRQANTSLHVRCKGAQKICPPTIKWVYIQRDEASDRWAYRIDGQFFDAFAPGAVIHTCNESCEYRPEEFRAETYRFYMASVSPH